MQDNNENAQKRKEAIEALERVMRGGNISDEEIAESLDIIGEALNDEYQERERNTKVKMPHLKGLQAAQDFENFVKTHLKDDLLHFSRTVDHLGDEICCEAIVKRILVENIFTPNVAQEFSRILNESTGIDIGIETDDPKYAGNIYFGIGFPAIMRAKQL